MIRKLACAVLTLGVIGSAVPAVGQTGPGLLLKPWVPGTDVELSADAYFSRKGTTDNDADLRLSIYEASGRARYRTQGEPDDPKKLAPRVGFRMTWLDLSGNDPALPRQLSDQSVAAGFELGRSGNWRFAMTIGIGYAGENPFSEGDGFYATSNLAAEYQIDPTSSLALVLNYDGNRSVFPDIPLPGVTYTKRIDDKLQLALGFPVTAVLWKPSDEVTVLFSYLIPDDFELDVSYAFTRQLAVYTSFRGRTESFTVDDLDGNDRLFFRQRRAEVGLRVNPNDKLSLTVAAGYAFSQAFESGFSSFNTDDVSELSDEPYARVGLEFRY